MIETYFVYRKDVHGTAYVVKSDLESLTAAQDLATVYEAKDHHQHYFTGKQKPNILYLTGEILAEESL